MTAFARLRGCGLYKVKDRIRPTIFCTPILYYKNDNDPEIVCYLLLQVGFRQRHIGILDHLAPELLICAIPFTSASIGTYPLKSIRIMSSQHHYDKVIIFGPTGAVAGAAALEASKRNATVWLAMREPTKPVPAIPLALEQQQQQQQSRGTSKFHRVQADLTDPASVHAAITTSGAKTAFAYLMFGMPSMEPTFRAMKDAGVEHVVFLSAFSIHPEEDREQIPPERVIPRLHAQAELALERVGLAYTTLRAGQFASNVLAPRSIDRGPTPWEANVVVGKKGPPGDNISPGDVGKVAGAVLVRPPPVERGMLAVYLLGPSLLGERDMVEMVGRIAGRDIIVNEYTPGEMAARLKGLGMPPPVMEYMRSVWEGEEWWCAGGGDGEPFAGLKYAEVLGNIKKYSGYEPETLEEYVAAHL